MSTGLQARSDNLDPTEILAEFDAKSPLAWARRDLSRRNERGYWCVGAVLMGTLGMALGAVPLTLDQARGSHDPVAWFWLASMVVFAAGAIAHQVNLAMQRRHKLPTSVADYVQKVRHNLEALEASDKQAVPATVILSLWITGWFAWLFWDVLLEFVQSGDPVLFALLGVYVGWVMLVTALFKWNRSRQDAWLEKERARLATISSLIRSGELR